jgi:hypothetical protein
MFFTGLRSPGCQLAAVENLASEDLVYRPPMPAAATTGGDVVRFVLTARVRTLTYRDDVTGTSIRAGVASGTRFDFQWTVAFLDRPHRLAYSLSPSKSAVHPLHSLDLGLDDTRPNFTIPLLPLSP